MYITVVGTGYVGLVTGVCLSETGHKVVCVDIDKNKIEAMKKGKSPIYEPGLEELLKKNYSEKRLEFTTDLKEACKTVDAVFIAVGTPEKEDGSANLEYIYNAAKEVSESLEGDCLIVIKSTVPIGTNEKIEEYIKNNLKKSVKVEVASNPEFLSQGTAVYDTLHANRIVIGAESEWAENILKEIYSGFKLPLVITNRKSAEMIKYASNDFLALKLSFINEIANVCELVGANIEDVTKGMSYDPRIGDKFLKAGIGYGGSCFPKDTKALHWLANNRGYELKTIKATIEVNQNQKFRLIKKAHKRFGELKGLKVAILGLTFKPGTDDFREAPSIPNIKMFLEEGAKVAVFDPIGEEKFKDFKFEGVEYKNRIEAALENADLAFIFTEWKEIKDFNLEKYKQFMKTPIVFDGRNCYDLKKVEKAGIEYYSIGRPNINTV